ncbi:MAG: DUF4416 family protein [candidate division KSB1 bacterium]|nr:DUF4416 family protein [candidate division KSB1 bacterium]
MGQPKIAVDVKLFCAITFANRELYDEVKALLEGKFGPVDTLSAEYEFNYTQYYAKEMGLNLKKRLIGFEQLIRPELLPEIKLQTNTIEQQFSIENKRRVNIDPGYLAEAKVVLATTKNFDHRIYLGKGIYGDVHLRYRRNKFIINEWTYPDYRDKIVIDFFARLRKKYLPKYLELIQLRKQGKLNEVGIDL